MSLAGPNAYFEPYNGATSVSNQMFQAGDHQAVHAQAHGVGGFPTWSPPLYSTQSYIPLEGPLLTMASGQQNNTVPSSSLDPASRTSLPAPQHQHDPTALSDTSLIRASAIPSNIPTPSSASHPVGSTAQPPQPGQASTTSTSSEAVPNALNTSPESSTVAQYLADLQRSADSLIPVRPDVTRNKNKFAPNKRNPEKFWTNFFSATIPSKQAAKDLIMHRLATKTCFDLDKDQALVWEEFVDFFNQCEQNFELIPLNARKELVAASFTSIIGDAYAAFKFPALSVVVIPGDPNNAPEQGCEFNIAPPENKLSPLAWLAHERPNVAAGFRAGMQAYAHYFFDSIAPDHSTTLALPTAQAETTSESTADQSDNQNKNKRRLKSPDIYKVPLLGERDGIRLWALDDNDRYLRAGHDESKWGWKYIMANMDNLCYPDVIPVVTAENKPTTRATLPGDVNWNKDHLNAWIGLIQSHQKDNQLGKGMLFKPTPKAKAIAAFSPELLPSEDSRTVTNARLVLTNSPDENDSVPAFGGTQNVNIGQLGVSNAQTHSLAPVPGLPSAASPLTIEPDQRPLPAPATTPAAANVMVDKPRTEVPYEQLTPAQKRKRTRALNLAKQAAQTEATNPRVARSSLNIEAAQNDGIGKRKVACLEMFEIAQFGHR
ncbi:SubName: Full=Uncharacterized protein {ECO:0000313/EMBL:CCA75642.1} [Serendipita indica DSM 11827]|nr:SubName: Full=Uncharacterized protein {ECO:0000313/EMBL:CCA75642.1} [Serendipita indica DSM 11827]